MNSTNTAAEATNESDLQPGDRITGLIGKSSGQGGVLISRQSDQVRHKPCSKMTYLSITMFTKCDSVPIYEYKLDIVSTCCM